MAATALSSGTMYTSARSIRMENGEDGSENKETYCVTLPLTNWPERGLVSRGEWRHNGASQAATVMLWYSKERWHDGIGVRMMQLGTVLEFHPFDCNVPWHHGSVCTHDQISPCSQCQP